MAHIIDPVWTAALFVSSLAACALATVRKERLSRISLIYALSVWFLLGTGALCLGWFDYLMLPQVGETVPVDRAEVHSSAKGTRLVTYTYTAAKPGAGRESYTYTCAITKAFAESIHGGRTMMIAYLPGHPEISSIAGDRYLLLGDIIVATIIMLLVEGSVGALLYMHIRESLAFLKARNGRTARAGMEMHS